MSETVPSISIVPTTPGLAPMPAPARAQVRADKSGFVGAAKLLSVMTLLSRVLGMARESVVSAYFGAGTISTAFAVAFKIPNLFRKLLGEGALSAAFIPLYAQSLKAGDIRAANEFAAASVNLLGMILLALTGMGEIALLVLDRFVPMEANNLLIVRFTAIMLPYVLLICGTAFLSGILQVHRRFAVQALAPVLLNVIHIGVIVIGARFLMLNRASGDHKVALQTQLAYWLAGFVLVAGVLQIAILLPSLRATGFKFMIGAKLWTPVVKKMLRLSVPLAISTGVLQLSVVLDTAISMFLTPAKLGETTMHRFGLTMAFPLAYGAVARLNWAQFLYQFPLGVFAISLATAIFPGLSADAFDHDRDKFKGVLRHGILLTLLEGLPASVGLILVRYPAVRLVLQHGQFTKTDTNWVALSLIFYSAGIWAFSLQQIMNRAYYALHDTVTPLRWSIVTIVVNTVVEIPLCFSHLGEAGMAVGTLVSFAAQAIVMLIILDRKVGGLGLGMIAAQAAKMVLACAAMGAACLWLQMSPIYHAQSTHTLASLGQLGLMMVIGGAVYAGVCWATEVKLR